MWDVNCVVMDRSTLGGNRGHLHAGSGETEAGEGMHYPKSQRECA